MIYDSVYLLLVLIVFVLVYIRYKQTIHEGFTDKEGRTPLLRAAAENRNEIVAHLVALQANLNAKDLNGKTALIHAVENKCIDVVNTLITAKVKVDLQDSAGQTALMYAAEHMLLKMVRILIKAGADVNLQNTANKYNALMYCLNSRYYFPPQPKKRKNTVLALINAKTDLSLRDKQNCTVFVQAIIKNDPLKGLLRQFSKITVEDLKLIDASLLQYHGKELKQELENLKSNSIDAEDHNHSQENSFDSDWGEDDFDSDQ